MPVNFLYGIPSGEMTYILGIATNECGRSCIDHPIGCGHYIEVGDIVSCKCIELGCPEDEGAVELLLEVHRVVDDKVTCRVGFLGKHLLHHSSKYDGKFARVLEIYSENDASAQKCKMHYKNKGCACIKMFALAKSIMNLNEKKRGKDSEMHDNKINKKTKTEGKN